MHSLRDADSGHQHQRSRQFPVLYGSTILQAYIIHFFPVCTSYVLIRVTTSPYGYFTLCIYLSTIYLTLPCRICNKSTLQISLSRKWRKYVASKCTSNKFIKHAQSWSQYAASSVQTQRCRSNPIHTN